MADEKDDGLAMSIMETQLLSQGVGTLRMKDGQMFMFSEHVLETLLEKARQNPEKRVMMFIKAGPDAKDAVV